MANTTQQQFRVTVTLPHEKLTPTTIYLAQQGVSFTVEDLATAHKVAAVRRPIQRKRSGMAGEHAAEAVGPGLRGVIVLATSGEKAVRMGQIVQAARDAGYKKVLVGRAVASMVEDKSLKVLPSGYYKAKAAA